MNTISLGTACCRDGAVHQLSGGNKRHEKADIGNPAVGGHDFDHATDSPCRRIRTYQRATARGGVYLRDSLHRGEFE